MIKRNMIFGVVAIMIISVGVLGCTNQQSKNAVSETNISNSSKSNKTEEDQQVEDSLVKVDNIVTKIEGRKEFLERLDNIQKELDTLPEKKDSDAGVTNAMRSYYGKSYDMYDKALNDIYTLLKNQLSQETLKNLQSEQIKWIKQKETIANKEASQYTGGTFEFVAYNLSLSESTKKRCYELINKYMTE